MGTENEHTAKSAWHNFSVEECERDLGVSADALSDQEVEQRLAKYGPNRLEPPKRRSGLVRFLLQFHNVLVYVLLVAAAVTGFLGMLVDTAVIVGVVVINAIVGFLQEGKAERALEAVRGMLSPDATVVRNGQRVTVPAEQLVPGDRVVLESGDKIPADLRLVDAVRLQIDEAMLTGESVPASKNTDAVAADALLGDRTCIAFSGTFATGGQGSGIVIATAEATELGRINTMLSEVQTLETPLTRQMDQFGRWLTAAILVVAGLTFGFGLLTPDMDGHSTVELFMATVGLAVAAIPEGLPAIVTITLAIGVQRMARRNAIIRRLPAVETLGAVSTICSDKTGTLTRNEMTVQAVTTPDGRSSVSGTGYAPDGALHAESGQTQPVIDLARVAVLASDAELVNREDRWQIEGDPTEGALVTLAAKAGVEPGELRDQSPRVDVIPFDPDYRYMATLNRSPDGQWISVKGAPEALLSRCLPINGETFDHDSWLREVEHLASQGMRTLAIARKAMTADRSTLEHSDIEDGLELLGIVGIMDPPRDEAIEAVAVCQEAGIQVKMITGDHALTARSIAAQIGIGNGKDVLTGADLENMNDEELRHAVAGVSVFARTNPEQKLRLVNALQARGELVAMTGGGGDDAPALKRADVGTAMGIKGTEVAKQSSEMVLADDNFASISQAVKEGRTVYQNLRKSIQFILPTNGAQAGVIIAAILFGLTLPITPVQILWVNMVTAVTLALTLAFEPAEPDIMRRPPRNASTPILDGFLLWRIALVSSVLIIGTVGVFLWELQRGEALEAARTGAINALVMGQVFYLLSVRYDTAAGWLPQNLGGNRWIYVSIVAVVVLQMLFTYWGPMNGLFGTAAIDSPAWLLAFLVGVLVFLAVESEKAIRRRGNSARRHAVGRDPAQAER